MLAHPMNTLRAKRLLLTSATSGLLRKDHRSSALRMPWIQDHLFAALELLPTVLGPEDEVPNFHRLKFRMAMIERQHFVLCLQEWIEHNGHWLGPQGLCLRSSRLAPDDGTPALSFYESFDDDRAHTGHDRQRRNEQVDRLIDLLDLHACSLNQAFVDLTVEDLNQVAWDPQRYRQVLAFKISDAVPDAYTWLGKHHAARQAKFMSAATPPITPRPGRRRL